MCVCILCIEYFVYTHKVYTHTHTHTFSYDTCINILCAVPPTTICFEKSISAEEERSASGKGGGIDVLTFPSEESSLPGFAMELEKGM